MSHETAQNGELRTIPLAEIHVEEEFNPRTSFERKGLEELAASIASEGVLQTVLVEPNGEGGYRLIAGERRLRAAAMAGLTEVPAKVRDPESAKSRLELALTENLSREELNPVEEAKAYRRLMDEEGLTGRGVVEHLRGRVSQKRVTERLQILEYVSSRTRPAARRATRRQTWFRRGGEVSSRALARRPWRSCAARRGTAC